jgi:membrane peptidoglycan carboxypeptidase
VSDGTVARPSFWARRKIRRAAKKARIRSMPRSRRIMRRVAIIGAWLVGLLAMLVATTAILFYTLSDVPRPESLPLAQQATLLYSDGSTMGTFGSVDRISVPLSQVPEQVRWDVLSAEDRNFYNEPGISITGTIRAAFNDLTGGDTQGGSGITQQYVKNAYLSNERTLTRKLKELAIAVKLDREYSKDTILEYYLNTVYFGRGAYGIEAGAKAFFGKDVSKLTTAEGAVLAAGLRAPTYYDPRNNLAEAKSRWRYVIDGMVDTGHLTQARASTMKYPHTIKPNSDAGGLSSGPKALIVQRVIAELEANGISEDEIYARGLTIRTTINKRAQSAAETAIRHTFAHLTRAQRNMKNALVAVAPKTGAVLAYYGGPDGKNYAGKPDYYDYAGLGFAAPGSSFKPYTLATALTQTMDHTSPGRPLTINSIVSGKQCVHIEATKICNDPSDAPYSSSHIKVRTAMKYSLNTTFDLMADHVGPPAVAKLARRAGISSTIDGKPSLTGPNGRTGFGIGIGDYPVHPIDEAAGFATFANHGVANPSYFVEQATASDGQVVYRHDVLGGTRALDPKVANDVTLTLEPIAAWSDRPLADGRVSAAKTGTEGIQTGKHAGGNSDAWMVGYTPQVSAAVWVGSGNSTTPIVNSYGGPEYGRDLPAQAWQEFMNTWLSGRAMLPMATEQQVGAPNKTAPATTTASQPATSPTSPTHTTHPSTSTNPPSTTVPSTTPPSTPPSTTAPSTSPPSTTAPPSTPTSTPPSSSAPPSTTPPATGAGTPLPSNP